MKNIITAVIFLIAISSQAHAQGNLHVKGKIKADSLANNGYLIIIADSSGTLDTLAPGQVGQVLVSNGLGQKPAWTTIDSLISFDPEYPDGFDNPISVNISIDSVNPYIIPAGKNLHITSMASVNNKALYINGYLTYYNAVPFSNGLSLIVGSGDTLTSDDTTGNSVGITGFLVDQTVIPVYHDIASSPFTVPAGQKFYLHQIFTNNTVSWYQRVFVNGVMFTRDYKNFGFPAIFDQGDVLTTENVPPAEAVIFGYLK